MDPARPLLDLQGLDTAIDRLRTRLRAVEDGEGVAAARAEADEAERALGELRLRLAELARDQSRFEHEIDSMTQKEAAEERRMFDGSVANARELDSIRHEVENLKRRRSDREDELLTVLEIREGVEAEERTAAQRSEATRAKVGEIQADADEELHRMTTEMKGLEEERRALVETIDPELLELYEDLRPQKKGVAAVELIDGVCQGCHEQLSAVYVDRLKRATGPKRCEHCRRILIFT